MEESLSNITPADARLKIDLIASISSNSSLATLVERVWLFKREGGQQTEAIHILESMRNEATGKQAEDIVLDLLDFVTGYCSPTIRIWE